MLTIPKKRDKKYKGVGNFIVIHTAEPVKYDSTGFVEKNADEIPELLENICLKSESEMIKNIWLKDTGIDLEAGRNRREYKVKK